MLLSKKGLSLLKRLEGFRRRAYQDEGGVWTIGYGHIEGVQEGEMITEEEASRLLEDELVPYEAAVPDMPQNQFDAFVIFAYNVGINGFLHSTALKRWKAGDVHGAGLAMLWWDKVNGKPSRGLRNRRLAEVNVLEYGQYTREHLDPHPARPQPAELEARPTPLSSRTIKAASVSTGLSAAAAASSSARVVHENMAAMGLSPSMLIAVILAAGLAFMVYCRIDDNKKGLR